MGDERGTMGAAAAGRGRLYGLVGSAGRYSFTHAAISGARTACAIRSGVVSRANFHANACADARATLRAKLYAHDANFRALFDPHTGLGQHTTNRQLHGQSGKERTRRTTGLPSPGCASLWARCYSSSSTSSP